MKLKHHGKAFVLTVIQEKFKGNQVMHINMDYNMAQNVEYVNDSEGLKTILRIEGQDAIDDLINTLIAFKQMKDL